MIGEKGADDREMSSRMKKYIRDIGKGTPGAEMLKEYLQESMRLHHDYAEIKMMLEYYMFYEMISEGINPYIDSVDDIVDALNEKIECYFEQNSNSEEREKMAAELLSMREEVIARMRVLTAYVDKIVVYEHILNRVQ